MATSNRTQSPRNEGELSLAPLSNALSARSDRPTRLENALNAFRDVLTADEREKLKVEMNVSRDPSQVIAFTAGLDLMDPNRRGKSIATRLHSILQTVQQFSQVVDTYVSSNPEIAALVWGSLTQQVLANFTSFFQTFSDLLDGFDALTPQFKEYQILFPDSLSLRNSIYDFHTAIISCCTQVISSTRRTWPQQALAAITRSFESEIGPSIAEIRKRAKLVKGQAALAKAQDDSRRIQRQEKGKHMLKQKWNSLLLKLSSYDHESAFNHARDKIHRGTAEWIFSTSEFQDWYESVDSCVLNISGKIGSGKTLLAANVISHLLQKSSPSSSVSYLFIRFDDENSRLADMILRSLICQSLTGREVQDSLKGMLERSESTGFERNSLLSLLNISLLEDSFLVIDGLDQCSPQEQHTLLQTFSRLMQMSNGHGRVKILVSGRESTAKEVDRALAPTKHLRTGLADTSADLARGQLVLGDESIMDQIVHQLQTSGEGMFLWVFLTIEDICCCPTDHDIRQALEVLPRSLSDSFNRALKRIASSQSTSIVDLVQRTFKWVATVRRPLTRWQLGEALGVKILQKASTKDQIINGTERLPSWCENLIHIEAGDETVRFFHHSIKTHLLEMELNDTVPELGAFHIDMKAWDHEVGEICLTYPNLSDFEKAMIKVSRNTNNLQLQQIAKSDEGRRILAAVGNQAALDALPGHTAARFLRRVLRPKEARDGCNLPQGVSNPTEPATADGQDYSEFFEDYPFLIYAAKFWLHHSFHFHQPTTKTWHLWVNQVNRSILEDDKFFVNFGRQPPGFESFEANKKAWVENLWHTDERRKLLHPEVEALHKAFVFADFIAHRVLLTFILRTIKDRNQKLSQHMLMFLLPDRRVFQFHREREGYIKEENCHDGLISLVTEFVACDGPMDLCPVIQDIETSPYGDNCAKKPMHMHMAKILSGSDYSRGTRPWLPLFAKIVILGLTKETSDAIEKWTNSKIQCIHEARALDGRDIIDIILEIRWPSSSEYAHWVLDLHKCCVGGRRYKTDYWRHKLQVAIENRNMDAVEYYLQESKLSLAWEKECCRIDYKLLREISDVWSLSSEFRYEAISIAIPGVAEENLWRLHEEFEQRVISGDWDIIVVLSQHGIKLADA
ncbi:Vegetative incompatibility protein HET-E-1 [Colletotrichum siamense]|nr:Vegetative incompatibility protein HET-E-1 [Colletotrichum siamense]